MGGLTKAVLKIDLGAIAENWKWYRDNCPNSEIAGVVKADAYGLGMAHVAPLLFETGCRTFFVAHVTEGLELRRILGDNCIIYVLNGVFGGEAEILVRDRLRPIINSSEQFSLWKSAAPFGLHIDTGMSRLGLRHDLDDYSDYCDAHLVMSHLACASDPSHELNTHQLDRFQASIGGFSNSTLSLSASAGAMLGNKYHFDLIRPGIGLYGGNPLDIGSNKMKCVATLEAPIIQSRLVKAGETIGYGATFVAQKDMEVAILAIGYADGFLRSASNKGRVHIDGAIAPILGRVSMDLIAIDVSDIGAKMGEYAQMIGDKITIDEQAKAMGTISYEILTRLGARFDRVYV